MDDLEMGFKSTEDDAAEEGEQQFFRSNNSNVGNHHSEVEKRRRDRMNTLLNQLATLVPSAASRKYDKLTVLRLALQYINTIQNSSLNDLALFGPSSSITYNDLNEMLEKCGDHFLLMTLTQTAEILYVSENIAEKLQWTVETLCNRSWVDVLHPNDTKAFLKFICFEGEFSSADADSAVPEKTLMKNGKPSNGVDQMPPAYRSSIVVRLAKNPLLNASSGESSDYVTIDCRVAMRNPQTKISLIVAKLSKVSIDLFHPFVVTLNNTARIQRSDETVNHAIERLSHDLVGSSYFDLIFDGDLLTVSQLHKFIVCSREARTATYRIRSSPGTFVTVTATWKAFINPFTNKPQFITIKHFPKIIESKTEQDIRQSTLKQMLRNHNDSGNEGILGVGRYGDL